MSVTIRIDEDIHEDLMEYCHENRLTINEALARLLRESNEYIKQCKLKVVKHNQEGLFL
jgi:antitoxin component of RelBE/YafQ-DinJ toxin-antitoxin module